MKVLLVEDNIVAAQTIAMMLIAQNPTACTISIATTLNEAINKGTCDIFDLVILDLHLPDSEGIATFKTLSASIDTPVIIVSGMDDKIVMDEAAQHGVLDYFVKGTFNYKDLIERIQFAIHRQAQIEMCDELRDSAEQIEEIADELRTTRIECEKLKDVVAAGDTDAKPKPETGTN